MTDNIENWITTSEAAQRLGVTSRWITNLINRGEVSGRKINPQLYLVYAPDVEAYRAKMRGKSSEHGE